MKRLITGILSFVLLLSCFVFPATVAEATDVYSVKDAEWLATEGSAPTNLNRTLSADGTYVTYTDTSDTGDPQILYNFLQLIKDAPYMTVKYRSAATYKSIFWFLGDPVTWKGFKFNTSEEWSYFVVDFSEVNLDAAANVRFDILRDTAAGSSVDIAELRFFTESSAAESFVKANTVYTRNAEWLATEGSTPTNLNRTLSADGTYVTYTDTSDTGDPQIQYDFLQLIKDAPYMLVKYRSAATYDSIFWFLGDPVTWKGFKFNTSEEWSYFVVDFSEVNLDAAANVRFDILRNTAAGSSVDIAELRFFGTEAAAEAYVDSLINSTPGTINPSTGESGSMALIASTALISMTAVTLVIFRRKRITA